MECHKWTKSTLGWDPWRRHILQADPSRANDVKWLTQVPNLRKYVINQTLKQPTNEPSNQPVCQAKPKCLTWNLDKTLNSSSPGLSQNQDASNGFFFPQCWASQGLNTSPAWGYSMLVRRWKVNLQGHVTGFGMLSLWYCGSDLEPGMMYCPTREAKEPQNPQNYRVCFFWVFR